jgi:NAD(P)-dependent dehydrogenase (short-subunit alcohol dehydrogenase family)
VQADVSRAAEVQRLFEEAQRMGGLDIVVANAWRGSWAGAPE